MHIFGELPQEEKKIGFFVFHLRFEGFIPSIRSDVLNLIGLELLHYWNDQKDSAYVIRQIMVCILFDIDRICKQIIRVFYKEKR